MRAPRIATRPLPEALQILEHNGIDVNRVMAFEIKQDFNDGGAITEITVTIMALRPAEDST